MDRIVVSLNLDDADDLHPHLHHHHHPQHYIRQICDGVGTLVHSATLADVSLEGFLHDQVDNTHMS